MQIIENEKIEKALNAKIDTSNEKIESVLQKARELKGINYDDVLALLQTEDPQLVLKIHDTAKWIKDQIYGNRLVLFAPLYISNLCSNECLYCAFRCSNKDVKRKALSQEEIKEEVEILLDQGHKRILLVAGEAYPKEGLKYIFDSIKTVYETRTKKGNIRRLNVNIAPITVEEFRELKKCNIGTYQLFQETYHRPTYEKLHLKGPKSDYDYRLETIDRAFEAGFDDLGIGILFGLYDWKYEILAMLSHIKHLEKRFGIGPHTISVPRLEPAQGSVISEQPPYPVTDEDFKKIVAVLRIAVPYTGMILSTRETAEMRRECFELGISQISAGSRTNPGGYREEETSKSMGKDVTAQFSLGDTRPIIEVIRDIVDKGHIPSFCTACYRLGRVGKDFMDLAKPGLIKSHCLPNAILTFSEYLEDFADNDLIKKGYDLIDVMIKRDIEKDSLKQNVKNRLLEIKNGKRDLFY